mgnify:CR=1 FL=1
MDYKNKRKYKKYKAKDKARKKKAKKRGDAIKADNREQKAIEKLKWQHRERLKPAEKQKED